MYLERSLLIAHKVHDLIHQDRETRSLEGMKLTVGDSQKIPLPFTNTVFRIHLFGAGIIL